MNKEGLQYRQETIFDVSFIVPNSAIVSKYADVNLSMPVNSKTILGTIHFQTNQKEVEMAFLEEIPHYKGDIASLLKNRKPMMMSHVLSSSYQTFSLELKNGIATGESYEILIAEEFKFVYNVYYSFENRTLQLFSLCTADDKKNMIPIFEKISRSININGD